MYIVIALKIKKRWQNINVKKRVFVKKYINVKNVLRLWRQLHVRKTEVRVNIYQQVKKFGEVEKKGFKTRVDK